MRIVYRSLLKSLVVINVYFVLSNYVHCRFKITANIKVFMKLWHMKNHSLNYPQKQNSDLKPNAQRPATIL